MEKELEAQVEDFAEWNELFTKCDDTQRDALLRTLQLWFKSGGNVHDLDCFHADLTHNAKVAKLEASEWLDRYDNNPEAREADAKTVWAELNPDKVAKATEDEIEELWRADMVTFVHANALKGRSDFCMLWLGKPEAIAILGY